ncbi:MULTISPECIES: helix-hairpin-helix domain-containing protein [unclassified Pseudomonas]|uniref:ComEA family DNA-binding protein n=1 Tax=unclassified Pseudomonas TaxID=196821 RepID=UPI000D3B4613|nr:MULTISPECIES: helix-hairpin-helix domain-containing protein [unclassified Pseudomonas]RAU47628.1 helix-hairpin-helix domain-containing protein [Pseudomonas sp. RIT 409]RAU52032.1 helix-hairpin-helix domain-containing protein [Pseudomonas sp. RIT 412]
MRMPYLSSLLFALIASTSIAATAAPAAVPSQPPAAATTAAEQSGKVNLNSANAETLQKELSGIGASKAAAIVAYREENGAFTSVDELIEVKGIGKALLDKNRDKLALD